MSGISLRALARTSHYDVGYLSKVINGYRTGSRELALDMDKRLRADGALLAAWERSARLPVPMLAFASPPRPTRTCMTGSARPWLARHGQTRR
jgi:hypothetical protein